MTFDLTKSILIFKQLINNKTFGYIFHCSDFFILLLISIKKTNYKIKKESITLNYGGKMEIIIIGGIAAGMSVAAKAKRVNKNTNITVIEKESYISFGACGLPYYLGNQFEDPNNMFARTPQQIEESGINLMLKHEVLEINFKDKKILVKNLENGITFEKSYDKLMISSGAVPIIPNINGINSDNFYTITKLSNVEKLKKNLPNYEKIVIVGAGFIGIEVAEQLAHLGKKITLIQGADKIINGPFDPEFSDQIQKALEEKGIKIVLNEKFENLITENNAIKKVITTNDKFDADAVILAIGFKPNTSFIKDENLAKLPNGAIIIDKFGRTSIKDVFAAGDCATVPHKIIGDIYLPLATSANKLGRLIGTNIVSDEKNYDEFIGTLGSCSIKVGDFEAGSTGLTEKLAIEKGFNIKTTIVNTNNHTNYWPGQSKITIKLVYDANTKVILGAQVFGKSDAILRMTGLTTAIYAGLKTSELGFIDFAYSPPFASTWEAINVAANAAK